MSSGTVCSWNQGQGEHLSLIRMLSLHSDHGTKFGQRKHSFGNKLVSNIWIIISAKWKYTTEITHMCLLEYCCTFIQQILIINMIMYCMENI